jgi:4-amino-4-deoxy-L-arabinose transferase-like glycosyltransferase
MNNSKSHFYFLDSKGIALESKNAIRLLVLVSLSATGLFMASISWLKWPDLLIDFGAQVYIPWRLSEGQVLYRDIPSIYGPLSHYLHALLFKIFGPGISVLIGFNLLIVAGLSTLIYSLFKKLANPLTGFLCAFAFLTLFAFGQYQGGGNYNFICAYVYSLPHGVALSFLALFFFLKFLENPQLRYLGFSGGVVGLVYWTKMEVFVALAFPLFLGLLTSWFQRRLNKREAVREALMALTAFMIPVLLFYSYFLTKMPLKEVLLTIPSPFSFLSHVSSLKQFQLNQWILGFDQPAFNLLKLFQYFFILIVTLGFVIGVDSLLSGPLKHIKRLSLLVLVSLMGLLYVVSAQIPWLYLGRPLPLLSILITGYYTVRLVRALKENLNAGNDLFLTVFSLFCTIILLKIILNTHLFHYGFALALPATLLTIHTLLFLIPEHFRALKKSRGFYQTATLALILFFIYAHVRVEHQVYQFKTLPISQGRDLLLDYDPGLESRGVVVNQTLDYLNSRLQPGIEIATVPFGSMINYLSRHPHPLPVLNFNPYNVALYGDQSYLESLQKASSPYILLVHVDAGILVSGKRFFGKDFGQSTFAWIMQNYTLEQQFGQIPFSEKGFGIQILKRKSAPVDH